MERTASITELMSLISSIKRSLQGLTYTCQSGNNLTSGQLGLLFALKHHGPLTGQELAQRLSLTPGAISQLVETLFEIGFITRTPREDDRRILDLSLSPSGAVQVAAIEKERHAIIEKTTANLTDTELHLLVSAHQKILHALQNEMKITDRK